MNDKTKLLCEIELSCLGILMWCKIEHNNMGQVTADLIKERADQATWNENQAWQGNIMWGMAEQMSGVRERKLGAKVWQS